LLLLLLRVLLGISETLYCSRSTPRVNIVPLLDVLHLLMLFAGTLIYSEPGTFPTIIFIICYKCYCYQHGFTRTKSTVNNLVTFLEFFILVVRGKHQADVVYFELSNAFDLVPHNMLLHKLKSVEIFNKIYFLNFKILYLT
jgi:hypothetical protein